MTRTGIRSGRAPSDTVHVAGPTKAGTLCGKRPVKAFGTRPTVGAMLNAALGTPCEACVSKAAVAEVSNFLRR